jgi:hypothetical protein
MLEGSKQQLRPTGPSKTGAADRPTGNQRTEEIDPYIAQYD